MSRPSSSTLVQLWQWDVLGVREVAEGTGEFFWTSNIDDQSVLEPWQVADAELGNGSHDVLLSCVGST